MPENKGALSVPNGQVGPSLGLTRVTTKKERRMKHIKKLIGVVFLISTMASGAENTDQKILNIMENEGTINAIKADAKKICQGRVDCIRSISDAIFVDPLLVKECERLSSDRNQVFCLLNFGINIVYLDSEFKNCRLPDGESYDPRKARRLIKCLSSIGEEVTLERVEKVLFKFSKQMQPFNNVVKALFRGRDRGLYFHNLQNQVIAIDSSDKRGPLEEVVRLDKLVPSEHMGKKLIAVVLRSKSLVEFGDKRFLPSSVGLVLQNSTTNQVFRSPLQQISRPICDGKLEKCPPQFQDVVFAVSGDNANGNNEWLLTLTGHQMLRKVALIFE